MDGIDHDQDGDGAVEGRPLEEQHVGEAQHHTGDSARGHGQEVQYFGDPRGDAGGGIGGENPQHHPDDRHTQCDEHRIEQVLPRAHPEGLGEILQGQGHVRGVLAEEGQHREGDDGQDAEDRHEDGVCRGTQKGPGKDCI